MQLIVHCPKEAAARQELSVRAAQCHAEAVIRRIRELSCSGEEKLALLDAIIRASSK